MLTTIECCALSSSATSSPWTLSRGAKKVRWSSGYPSRKRPSALYLARSSHTSGVSAIVTPLSCVSIVAGRGGYFYPVGVRARGLAGHLVVAVGQVAGQGGLGGGVHGAGLGQPGLALQVLDRRGGLRSHDAVDGALVVVQLAELLLQRLDRRRRGNGRGRRLRRVGGRGGRLRRAGGRGGRLGRAGGLGRGGPGGRGGVAAAGQARDGQHDQGGRGDGADDDGGDAVPGGPVAARGGGAAGGGVGWGRAGPGVAQ